MRIEMISQVAGLKMSDRAILEATSKYARANNRKANWRLLDTLLPYAVLWALMLHAVQQRYPYWLTLALAVFAAGLLVRIFILIHDCCHGSFFRSQRANTTASV
jgi:omega-6 fatty acid desaturase (delta-12 desaturase)